MMYESIQNQHAVYTYSNEKELTKNTIASNIRKYHLPEISGSITVNWKTDFQESRLKLSAYNCEYLNIPWAVDAYAADGQTV
jgi:hypothetical protein